MEQPNSFTSVSIPAPDEEEEQNHDLNEITKLPLLPTASITLSLSSLFSLSSSTTTTTTTTTKSSSAAQFSPFARLSIPSQISSLSLSLSSPSPSPSPLKFGPRSKSIASHTPLISTVSFPRRRPSEPSSAAAAARRCSIVWFRADLRVHDHEPLATASADSLSLLPVFLFDPRDFGKSASGFDKTGPHRASFLLDAVADLRRSLRARGSDLVVRLARPETALPELAHQVGAEAVYAHCEVAKGEVAAEDSVAAAMEKEGIEMKWYWGSTLYHIDDLPFDVQNMPLNYSGFREKVNGLKVREVIDAPEQVKGLPSMGDVEPGEIPTLMELGLTPTPAPAVTQDGKPAVTSGLVGGESEALERLKKFAFEWLPQPPEEKPGASRDSIYGANFSSKISPWLALGCLSPRFMFEELKKSATRPISASSSKQDCDGIGDGGTNWLKFELLWRDFFRFITKKYSSAKRKLDGVPATACTVSLA